MNKRLFAGIAAGMIAAVMCVSFAACGESGGDDPKDIKGNEVTEEQWTAAFEIFEQEDAVYTMMRNETTTVSVTLNLTQMNGDRYSGGSEVKYETRYVKNGAKEYWKEVYSAKVTGDYEEIAEFMGGGMDEEELQSRTEEVYVEYKDGRYTQYVQEDGEWTKGFGMDSMMYRSHLQYKNQYGNFTYSESNQGYVYKNTVLKFDKDGKLVAIIETEYESDTEDYMTYRESYIDQITITYTADAITIPTIAE